MTCRRFVHTHIKKVNFTQAFENNLKSLYTYFLFYTALKMFQESGRHHPDWQQSHGNHRIFLHRTSGLPDGQHLLFCMFCPDKDDSFLFYIIFGSFLFGISNEGIRN